MEIRYYLIFLLITIVIGCKEKEKQTKIKSESYYYIIRYKDTDRIDYGHKIYEYSGDTIKVEASRYNVKGEKISNPGEDGVYLKSYNKLYALRGKESSPILGDIIFDTSTKNSCSEYFHPFYHQIENFFQGLTEEKNYKFNSSQQATDGFDWEIVLDTNFSLIEKVNTSPLEGLKSETRSIKSKIPDKVLKNARQ